LLLDEPTSGLDSSIAYEVISCLRDLTRTSKCHLSIILTIHQPNSRLLELFDHLLLLEQGSCLFFGTLEESFPYFTSLGYTCPPTVTATDYFLQISDTNFASKDDGQFDFVGAWPTTNEAKELQAVLSKHDQLCQSGLLPKPENPATAHGPVPFWKKVGILVWRDYTIAYRDPTLYYFQAMMLMSFAFLTGAVFWKLPKEINGNFNIFPAGLLWIVFFHTWVHAFKVFHLSSSDKRAQHEIYNQKYTPLAVIIADTISVSTLAVVFFGVPPIAYFMMGYPSEGFPFIILASWLACISGEAMIALITKFSQDPTTAMVFCQIALVSLQVFGGGVFLPWRDCPTYWMWLQEMTVFAQATRTMNMEVFRYLDLKCLLAPDGKCYDPSTGAHYRCDSYYSDGIYCTVNGREVLAVTQGIGRDQDYWWYFGYLCAIYVCFKIAIGFFTFFPWYRVQYWLTQTFIPPTKLAPTQEAFEPVPPSSPRGARGGGGDLEEGIPSPEMPSSRKSSFHEPNQFMGLAWSKFNVILPQSGVKLVDNVCGHVPSGHILALMGPSGAGKTTLLNGLARRAPYAKLTGSVRFGGREMNSQDLTYIPQFDEVNDVLTVWEHIHLVGLLTCEDHVVMTTRAEELLMVLGLTKKRDIQVRHLSSGELKRLSVGIGLISNPFVLFLDEPTTGLDSTAAYSIVSYLAIVAKATQVAVIMTLHQPSSLVFDMIDDLFLLESGKVVYSGPIRKASPYFASIGFDNPNRINPADYYLDLALKPPSNEETWPALFQKSPYAAQYFDQTFKYASYNLPIQSPPYPSFASRFQTMLHHFSRYLLIEPGYLVYRLFALIATGIFLGTLFLQLETKTNQLNSYSGAMFSAAIAVMLTAISATGLYARDRREAVDRIKNGFYSPGLYVLTQFMVSAFYNWFLAFVFTCIFHWLTNINPNKISFIYDIFISWGHILLMESALLLFVEILKNDFLATTSGMIFIGCCMLFAGFFRQVSEIPASISWMCFAIPFRVSSLSSVSSHLTSPLYLPLGPLSGRSMASLGRSSILKLLISRAQI
jgi:ABC-type multidrug transport system ATPase subunit